MLISNILMDWVVPLFPIYQGDMMLSCICMSVFFVFCFDFLIVGDVIN